MFTVLISDQRSGIICIRHILTNKEDPRTDRIRIFILAVYTYDNDIQIINRKNG